MVTPPRSHTYSSGWNTVSRCTTSIKFVTGKYYDITQRLKSSFQSFKSFIIHTQRSKLWRCTLPVTSFMSPILTWKRNGWRDRWKSLSWIYFTHFSYSKISWHLKQAVRDRMHSGKQVRLRLLEFSCKLFKLHSLCNHFTFQSSSIWNFRGILKLCLRQLSLQLPVLTWQAGSLAVTLKGRATQKQMNPLYMIKNLPCDSP